MPLARAATIFALLFSSLALAQTPGLGDTRPVPPSGRDDAPPALGDSKEPRAPQSPPRPSDADRALSRCQELPGAPRDDCLREERSAAGGESRRAEPPTAPPPQNPR
jgi:hypothetical protein